jgi:AraC-like DNA-binding protein
MPSTHKIDARLACLVVEEFRRRKEPFDNVLKEVGLRRIDVADPETRIPYASTLGLIERAATLLDDPSLGLRLGALHDVQDSGLLGFVVLNSPTLMDALANLQRYFRVIGEGEDVELNRSGPHVVLRFRETDPDLRGLRHNSEYLAAVLVRACRDMTRKRISPLRAEFMHGRPNAKVKYAEYLGCPVKFHAEWDALVYSPEVMRLPVLGADKKLLRVLENACRKVLGPSPKRRDLVHEVRELIVARLAKGKIEIDDMASEVNMSTKTLERRLTERGVTFSKLLEDIRCDLAKRYLADTDFRLEQIAYLVGYSEPAVLVRAFKRWTKTTPMQFRNKMR